MQLTRSPPFSQKSASPPGERPPAGNAVFTVTADGLATPLAPEAVDAIVSVAPARIERALGIRDPDVLRRLGEAISAAILVGRPSALVWRKRWDAASLLIVRPAREAGAAIVRHEALTAEASRPNCASLVDLFGLSPSEAEIAAALAGDATVAEIASGRGVRIDTVRGQIKTLLRKMELTSQKQLVRVLTRVAIALA
ncbi:MAG: helix-turn-helix transcriptional regulator [Gemmatimonadales bacterium]